jgi:hypothetical protein
MDAAFVRATLRRIIRNELGDCDKALNDNDVDKAKRKLDEAITKLKRLANNL